MIPSAVVAAALIGLTAEGAIGANISVSGQEYIVTASQLNGTGFEQFGYEVSQGSKQIPVAESAIKSATLSNLCQAVTMGPVTLLQGGAFGRESGVRKQPDRRRELPQWQRHLPQHCDRPGRRDAERGSRHGRDPGHVRRAGRLGND